MRDKIVCLCSKCYAKHNPVTGIGQSFNSYIIWHMGLIQFLNLTFVVNRVAHRMPTYPIVYCSDRVDFSNRFGQPGSNEEVCHLIQVTLTCPLRQTHDICICI